MFDSNRDAYLDLDHINKADKMGVTIKEIGMDDFQAWDEYVSGHRNSTLYQLSGWRNVIKSTYGHRPYYLMAIENCRKSIDTNKRPGTSRIQTTQVTSDKIIGILPLIHMKHLLFGNSLVSIPFFDLGGILSDTEEAETALLSKAIKLGEKLRVKSIELRHIRPLSWLESKGSQGLNHKSQNAANNWFFQTRSHKVRMLFELPESSIALMKSFKAKLRSQIKKPMKENLTARVGGAELSEEFYKVFCMNMRDLGSPVHSKELIKNVMEEFPKEAKIVLVCKKNQSIACSLIVGFRDILENPWASALRNYSRLAPNMLLYWSMLEYACDNGYKYFDFGRSSPDGGTYKFKEQWGARPTPLHWHYISQNDKFLDLEGTEKYSFDKSIQYWQKLPVPVTKIIGPMIRKHIGL